MSTTIDFDDEARKLFASLGLNKLGNGQVAGGKYNALDPIYSAGEGKGTVFVGNDHAARSRDLLRAAGITRVVNCTENIPNYHENDKSIQYLRFPISYWSQHVKDTHESVLRFLKPFFSFLSEAIEAGHSVLVHCLAGAHRAGTAGCLTLMHFHQLRAEDAILRAKKLRPAINPIGMLPMLLARYQAAQERSSKGNGTGN